MAWTYELISGRLYAKDGNLIGVGYSGSGEHKNDTQSQSLQDHGPIPVGSYLITNPRDTITHGPYVLPLNPAPNNLMWGRSGFLIHGDSKLSPGTASEGCIVMSRDVRELVWNSGDHELDVVSIRRIHDYNNAQIQVID